MNKVWSDTEFNFIKNNAGSVSDAEGARQLAIILGRPVSIHAWRKQRQKLGIHKSPGRGVCRLATAVVVSTAEVANEGLAGEAQALVPAQLPTEVIDTSHMTEAQVTDLAKVCEDMSTPLMVQAPAPAEVSQMASEGAPVEPAF